MPNIYIASDHAGFALKEELISYLTEMGNAVEDCGAYSFNEADDYPDFIQPCAKKVSENKNSFGIIIGGTGQGEAMVANRLPGVRACVYYGKTTVEQDAEGAEGDVINFARTHNNANVISLGARFISVSEAKEAVKRFLATPFGGGERHLRRISKLG